MKSKQFQIFFALLATLGLLLSACGPAQPTDSATEVVSAVRTSAAETIVAAIPTATNTSQPTITPVPSDTPSPSLTPEVTLTSTPTVTALVNDVACDSMLLISDMNPRAGEKVEPGKFNKSWRVQNNGSCPWLPGYRLMYIMGEKFQGSGILIKNQTAPGSILVLTLDLVAPDDPGLYTGYWRMYNLYGSSFGPSLAVSIVVPKPTPTKTPTPTQTGTPKPTKTPTEKPTKKPTKTPSPTP